MIQDASTKTLKTLVVVLGIALVLMLVFLFERQMSLVNLRESSTEMRNYMQAEKDSLRTKLIDIRDRYDSLQTNNDSMNLKLEVQKAYINKLIRIQGDNTYVLSRYKKEIGTLREVLRSYVVQVDSLLRIKEELTAENKDVKQKLSRSQEEKLKIEEEKNNLSQKVEKAEVLMAKSIVAVGLNKKSKEKFEADKIVKLRVCFTLRENVVAKAGNRMVYLRIVRPDDVVLTPSVDNMIRIKEETLIYSALREVNYQNADIDMCIYYDIKSGDIIPGDYKVEMYSGTGKIGESVMTITKGGGLF